MNDLRVEGVSVRFGDRLALDRVTVGFRPGEVSALTGPNGSGKSTLLDVIAGLRVPDSGKAAVPGRVGFVRQRAAVDKLLTPHENLRFFAAIHRIAEPDITGLLAAAGLSDRAHDRVGTLSGGMQRRVDLARALIVSPSVLLLDEPTAGLDPASRSAFVSLVHERTHADGMITVWVTHTPDEAANADAAFTMQDGRISRLPDASSSPRFAARTGSDPVEIVDGAAARRLAADAIDASKPFSCEPIGTGDDA